jgi:predicted nucleotidyltransferase component of viral defense system
MLTYESLIEQAGLRKMPHTKIRGILREYLQVLILKELYKIESGRKLYFTGGTYLRLVEGLKRFSEDLDFNTKFLTKPGFEKLMAGLRDELKRTGLSLRIRFNHWGNVYVAKLVFPEIEKYYDVVSKHSKKEGIMIKIEANKPKPRINTETKVITGFGEFYPCICTDKGILFADKIDALGKKNRGRHIYDIIFMLSNKYPVDRKFLSALGIEKKPPEAIYYYLRSFSKEQLKIQADVLRPFLFDEDEADLVANARTIIPALLEKYSK